MRNNSFWTKNLSFIDKILSKLRFKKVLDNIDLENKTIIDTWSWYNADLLRYIKKEYDIKDAIAYDIKLNKTFLENHWIRYIEWDLNYWIDLKKKVDVVFSTAIIEHLENPKNYIKSVYDILKKDWYLILTVPSTYSKPVLEFMAYNLKIIDKEEILDHKKYYDKKGILNLLVWVWFKNQNIHHKYFQFFMNNYCIAKK